MEIIIYYLLVASILALAYYIRGMSGYGSGLLAIPALALFMPLESVIPAIAVLDLLAALAHAIHYRRKVVWRELTLLIPIAILGMALGITMFGFIDIESLKPWLGMFIIGYAVYSLFPASSELVSRYWSIPLISTAGITDSLLGTGGPFYVIYLRIRQLDIDKFVATIAMTFMLVTAIRVGAYSLTGFYSADMLGMILLAIPIMAIFLYLGIHTHHHLTARQFRHLIAILLLTAGMALLLRT
ncbi:MAG: sulfite exporter TauE/SafE family protein [Gammaproteobacteria bacterium]|nr:sulfite exporter TauE/SafE family protein [Gammaproteobacteria bacterium]